MLRAFAGLTVREVTIIRRRRLPQQRLYLLASDLCAPPFIPVGNRSEFDAIRRFPSQGGDTPATKRALSRELAWQRWLLRRGAAIAGG
jgi:hypothetical protein